MSGNHQSNSQPNAKSPFHEKAYSIDQYKYSSQQVDAKPSIKFKFPSILSVLVSLIAIVAPFGYIIGYRYLNGFQHAFGLSSDTFPITPYEAYMSGYLLTIHSFGSIVEPLLSLISLISDNPVLVLIAFLGLCIFIAYILKKKPKKKSGLLSVSLKALFERYAHYPKAIAIVFVFIYVVSCLIWLVFTAYLLIIFLAYAPHKKGYELGLEQLDDYREKWCIQTNKDEQLSYLSYLVDESGDVLDAGILIEQQGNLIALFTYDTVSVRTLKNNQKLEKYYFSQSSDKWPIPKTY